MASGGPGAVFSRTAADDAERAVGVLEQPWRKSGVRSSAPRASASGRSTPSTVWRREGHVRITSVTTESASRAAAPRSHTTLLERDGELHTLRSLVDTAAGGEGGLGLIEGPAGVGKTRLMDEARRLAAEVPLQITSARGSELEREFPFGVVRQLFEPLLADPEIRERALDGAAAPAGAVFGPPSAPDEAMAGGDASFATLHGLYWLTVNLASQGPLLLAVDDLHWCDRPSLRFLSYLLRRLEGLGVFVLCTLRPAEPGADEALIADISGDPLTTLVRPRALTPPAARRFVRERVGEEADERFCAASHAATGGNPLLLGELLKAVVAEGVPPDEAHVDLIEALGPRAASRAVLLRLARMSRDAAALARATAVLGDGADLSHAAALAGLTETDAGAAAEALGRAEILVPSLSLAFVHPLVRSAVYHDLSPIERERQHARAAELLREHGASAEQVAAHLLQVRPRGGVEAVETLSAAAAAALAAGAPDSAAAYLKRALAEPPPAELRPQILRTLGAAEVHTSGPAAAGHLREAYDALADPVSRARLAEGLSRALLFTGEFDEAAKVAQEAAAELPAGHDDLRRRIEAFELLLTFFGVGDPHDLRRLQSLRSQRRPQTLGEKMLAAAATYAWTLTDGPADACADLALGALAGDDLREADPAFLFLCAMLPLVLSDREEAILIWESALADAHRRGSLLEAAAARIGYGNTLLRRGELKQAEAELRLARSESQAWGSVSPGLVYTGSLLAVTLLERGDDEAATATLASIPETSGGDDAGRWWLIARAEVSLARGQAAEAAELADEFARTYGESENPAAGPWRSLKAQALDRLGRPEEALELAREEVELAHRWGAPSTLGRSLRVSGTLSREDGLAHLEEAVAVLDGSPARLEHAKALAALGTALRHSRRPADAREPLRRALELAEVCGATVLADHARHELYATGARPRTKALGGVESLTTSERRVVDLAAEGHSNRDIAQALFVTPKTVEIHLTRAYRKLDVGSRRELAGVLARAE